MPSRLESARVKKALFGLLALAVIACGKRGDPHPPVPVIPKATSDLVVTQRGTSVILTWSYPALTMAGQNLHDIRRVSVYRYVEELPAPTAGRETNATLPQNAQNPEPQVSSFGKVPPLTPVQFGKLSHVIDSIEGANLPAASVGAKLEYDDKPPFHSMSGQPVRVTYAVVTVGASARSDLSNLASLVPLDVPVPPSDVKAEAKPAGVVLSWMSPEKAATGDVKPVLIGYNVYRWPAAQPNEDLSTPVNTSPIAETTYTDTPPYGEFRYRVTALASAGPPRIESEPSDVVTATFTDLLPPPPPASVTALVETKDIRLIWDPVKAADLRGYNIYRYQGDLRLRLKLTPYPATGTFFTDISIEPGIEYVYGISSVDKSGNESKETESEKVMVPRTP